MRKYKYPEGYKPDVYYHDEKKNVRYLLGNTGTENTDGVAYAIWGDFVVRRDYIKESIINIIKLSKIYGIKWKNINQLSKRGNPYHFSYISRINEPKEKKYRSLVFDIDEYLLLIK